MTERLSESKHPQNTKNTSPHDLGEEIFDEYEKRFLEKKRVTHEETHSALDKLKAFFSSEPKKEVEKPLLPNYNPLKLSYIAKEFLDNNHAAIKAENPDSACIIIYKQGENGQKSQAKRLCIPRLNPENKTHHVSGYALTPVPKSNGYNTEYTIKDAQGNNWSQLAILFPAENPKYKKKENLELSIHASLQKVHSLEVQLKKIERTKKNLDQRRKVILELADTIKSISSMREELKQYFAVDRFVHFSYIPYREGLNTPETQLSGFDYIKTTMLSAYDQKFQDQSLKNLKSNIHGKSIAEAIPWQYPMILNLVERMDFWLYFDSNIENLQPPEVFRPLMKKQLEKSLTTFAANTSDAFNWQVSKVGAQGIGQIMPDTYRSFQDPKPTKANPNPDKKYMPFFPEADFDTATREHATSFRIQIAHLDSQAFQFPKGIQNNWSSLMQDESTSIGILSLLAAGYNGSMRRIMDEVFGDILKNPPTNKDDLLRLYRKRLTPENIMMYMEKARDADIQMILSKHKIVSHLDKKTGKLTQPAIPQKVQDLIDARKAKYRESMTYVLKTKYVWEYLKLNYQGKF